MFELIYLIGQLKRGSIPGPEETRKKERKVHTQKAQPKQNLQAFLLNQCKAVDPVQNQWSSILYPLAGTLPVPG